MNYLIAVEVTRKKLPDGSYNTTLPPFSAAPASNAVAGNPVELEEGRYLFSTLYRGVTPDQISSYLAQVRETSGVTRIQYLTF